MNKFAFTTLFALSFSVTATYASACDMHGAGGFHGAFGTKWAPYTASGLVDDYTSDYANNYTPVDRNLRPQKTLEIKAKEKPTFSNFSRLASFSAKSKLAVKSDKSQTEQNIDKPDRQIHRKSALKSDR